MVRYSAIASSEGSLFYTEEVAATRRWLCDAVHMLRELNKRP